MDSNFLGQGLHESEESVGQLLIDSFGDPDFDSFSCIVAFASVAGIEYLRPYVEGAKGHIENFSVVVGVDQKGTSKEALENLLELDIGANVYHTRSPPTFHPKVYIFEGDEKVRVIVGSNNLTVPGLFQNAEASTVIEFTRPDDVGEDYLDQVKSYYDSLLDGSGDNVQALTSDLIEMLHEAEIIEDEDERAARTERTGESTPSDGDDTTGDSTPAEDAFPPIDVQTPPSRPSTGDDTGTPSGKSKADLRDADRGDLVWEKQNLPQSDAQDVTGNTNVTGQMRLAQAGWEVGGEVIDQTRYFRRDVFGGADWYRDDGREMADVWFKVTLNGDDLGLNKLRLIHDPEWEAKQRNVTTMIRWGDLMEEVKSRDLTGKDFRLYVSEDGGEPFYIDID